jgi:hypothetical protein
MALFRASKHRFAEHSVTRHGRYSLSAPMLLLAHKYPRLPVRLLRVGDLDIQAIYT